MPSPYGNTAASQIVGDYYGLGTNLQQQQQDETEEEKRRRKLGLSPFSQRGSAAAALMLSPTLVGPGTIGGRGY